MTEATPYFVHESSYVDEGATVGEGTKIWHFCHILPGAALGRDCRLGQNVNVGSKAVIGNNVKIQNNVSVYDGVVLEDDVFCGPSMVFTNVATPRSHVSRRDAYIQTLVRRGATLGANCTIVCGVTIGQYAFIGAGAVVTRDVPDYALVFGAPARQQGWMCHCGLRLDAPAEAPSKQPVAVTCHECASSYQLSGDGLLPAPESSSAIRA